MKSYIIILLFTIIATIGFSCKNKETQAEEGVYYTCSMHPEIKKDQPGACPVCGMDLVKKEASHDH